MLSIWNYCSYIIQGDPNLHQPQNLHTLNSVEISGFFCHSDFTRNQYRSYKTAIFAIFRALNFGDLVNSSLQKVQKFIKKKSKFVKLADFARQESSKLISRKIEVMGKS